MDQNYSDWQSLYTDQRKSLVDYAAKLTGMRDVAEDIVQEAFTICMSRDDRNYYITKAFLYTIVRNLVHNRRRHIAVHNSNHPNDFPWWIRHQQMDSPELQVVIFDQAKIAAHAIGSLPPKVREVVELYRFDELKLQEIADRLDISVATAHRLLKEGMETIWQEMGLDQ